MLGNHDFLTSFVFCHLYFFFTLSVGIYCRNADLSPFDLQREAVKRTLIKSLPPVLVIQLKRFGYDWLAGHSIKFDEYFKVRVWVLAVLSAWSG